MFPKLARYGSDVVAFVLISCVVIVLVSFFVPSLPVKIILDLIALFAAGFTIYFFRDPDRTPQMSGDDVIIAPADGKVVYVGEVEEPEFLKTRAKMVSIFMSPVNVHVNRIPWNGTVKFLKYIKGEYLVAFDEKSSDRNERMLIGIENKGQRMLFKQIAGFIARRIVCELSDGQSVKAGERFGMIKFGSRVDVLLPLNCDVKVKLDDKTIGGGTVLGVLKNE
ncbi:MAG: phosphatidylserine decarboxylase family protein [Bacteroidetes bacterium]|nr:phosphatidylserine decarboxylase family protein [Bacteroidota bacterium]MCL5737873.1 phosphatidylserine decarboxylase family protein [Bacteroidota bacterium]